MQLKRQVSARNDNIRNCVSASGAKAVSVSSIFFSVLNSSHKKKHKSRDSTNFLPPMNFFFKKIYERAKHIKNKQDVI